MEARPRLGEALTGQGVGLGSNKPVDLDGRIDSWIMHPGTWPITGHGGDRAWLHCRSALPLIHFIQDSLTYSVPV